MSKQIIRNKGLLNRPIGVFDSGLGGLTVVRELIKRLPNEDILYFGDLARLPYGIKSKEQIVQFSCANTDFLYDKGIKGLVVACNSSASASMRILRKRHAINLVDVIMPAACEAVSQTRRGRIGVIGTQATMLSKAYDKAIMKIAPKMKVFSQACPLFVPLVEEGWLKGEITRKIVKTYLTPLMRHRIDTLILGCTHYPLLKKLIQQTVGSQVRLIDSAGPTVKHLKNILGQARLLTERVRRGRLSVYVTDRPGNFVKVGERFLGRHFSEIRLLRAKAIPNLN